MNRQNTSFQHKLALKKSAVVTGTFSWKWTSECKVIFESGKVNIFDQFNGFSNKVNIPVCGHVRYPGMIDR